MKFTISIFLIVICFPVSAASRTVVVPDQYTKIQQAIDSRQESESLIIQVRPGIYRESLILGSGITLEAAEIPWPVIQPPVADGVAVNLAGVSNVEISGFVVTAADTGIFLDAADNIRLQRLLINDGGTGVHVTGASDVEIKYSVFSPGSGPGGGVTGVLVEGTASVTLVNNTFYGMDSGVQQPEESTSVRVEKNIFMNVDKAVTSLNTTALLDPVAIKVNCTELKNYFDDTGIAADDQLIGDGVVFVDSSNNNFHLQQPPPQTQGCLGAGDGYIDDFGAFGGAQDPQPVPGPVQGLRIEVMAANSTAKLTWNGPDESNYRFGGYRVFYRLNGNISEQQPGTGLDPNTQERSFEFAFTDVTGADKVNLGAPQVQVSAANRTLNVSWPEVPGASRYQVSYGKVAGTVTTTTVAGTGIKLTGLQNDVEYEVQVRAQFVPVYYFSVRSFDFSSEQVLSAVGETVNAQLGDVVTGEPGLGSGIPEAVVPFPDLPNEGCFIATAAYGSYSAVQVQWLRDFRDRFLLSNGPGTSFVHWYYRHSPAWAATIEKHPVMKTVTRVMLYPLVLFAYFMTQLSWLQQLSMLVMMLLIFKLLKALVMYRLSNRG